MSHNHEEVLTTERLRRVREEIMKYTRARNTVKTYEHCWQRFARWCSDAGRDPLPATPATVLDFATWRIELGRYRLSTIRTEIASIQYRHVTEAFATPVDQPIKVLLRVAARKLQETPRGKRALTAQQLRKICSALEHDPSRMAKRDHAMVLLGFASGWRRSELTRLGLTDLWFDGGEAMEIQLGASKTDQSGVRGRRVSIPPGQIPVTCPIKALRAWLAVRGSWQGPLFCALDCGHGIVRKGISGVTINLRLKRLLAAAGENPAAYGAHSLRAGMITSSAENGADVTVIMQRTGQRSVQTVMRYIRPAVPFKADPLKGVL